MMVATTQNAGGDTMPSVIGQRNIRLAAINTGCSGEGASSG